MSLSHHQYVIITYYYVFYYYSVITSLLHSIITNLVILRIMKSLQHIIISLLSHYYVNFTNLKLCNIDSFVQVYYVVCKNQLPLLHHYCPFCVLFTKRPIIPIIKFFNLLTHTHISFIDFQSRQVFCFGDRLRLSAKMHKHVDTDTY